MQRMLYGIGEYLAPILKESKFKETGVLTPEEFVAAGDFLVYKCPTWSWQSGIASKKKNYLPADKQFLLTKNVPCYKRVKYMEKQTLFGTASEEEEAEGWVYPVNQGGKDTTEDIQEIVSKLDISKGKESDTYWLANQIETEKQKTIDSDLGVNEDEDIPDMEDFEEDNLIEEDLGALSTSKLKQLESVLDDDNILKTRTYDLSITYDKYYQTPRIWLFGYDEHDCPLTPTQIFEDMSQDHAKKTVTIEQHPNLNMSLASVHPCRHANVMKKIIDHLVENGKELRVDQYLILFLKFMSAVLPTIDYDYTISMEG